MDKKNTMLLTVIAVATLLVAVVGATFAYFSVTGETTATTTNVTTSAEDVGTVALTQGQANFYLRLSAAQMSAANKNNTYYAQLTDIAATTDVVDPTVIATAKVTGGSDSAKYVCDFNYAINTNVTAPTGSEEAAAALAELKKNGHLYISAGDGVTGIAETYVLGNDTTGTGTITLVGAGTSTTISAYVTFKNADDEGAQTAMAGSAFTTTVKITDLACDTAE